MKRQLISFVVLMAAVGAHASTGTIRFVGALVEPTCQTDNASRGTVPTQGSVQFSDCRANPLLMASNSRAVIATRIFTGALQEFRLSAPVAAIAGRSVVQELVINYQ